jgi:hypothetical protein
MLALFHTYQFERLEAYETHIMISFAKDRFDQEFDVVLPGRPRARLTDTSRTLVAVTGSRCHLNAFNIEDIHRVIRSLGCALATRQ